MTYSRECAIQLLPVVILGAGGHAVSIINSLNRLEREIIGVCQPNQNTETEVLGVKIIGDDETVSKLEPDEVCLVNGIGMTQEGISRRHQVAEAMRKKEFQFSQVVDPSAVVSDYVNLGEGAQIGPGAIVQPRVIIGKDSILNTRSLVEHDCQIGKGSHICPGVTIAGNAKIGDYVMIGSGAVVVPGVEIGDHSMVAAGSVIYRDIPRGSRVIQKRTALHQ